MNKTNKIFLIGFMGTGKTTVAKELSKALVWNLSDTDDIIVSNTQSSINDIFQNFGEDFFRKEETLALKSLVHKENLIVSCGGGIVLKEENIDLLRQSGFAVLLTATPESIYDRLKFDSSRPLMKDNVNIDYIKEMLDKRDEFYKHGADFTVATDNKSAAEISTEIIENFKGWLK